MNDSYRLNFTEFYSSKQQIEKEIQIHKKNYCSQDDCYSEYNYVTFRYYACSADHIYRLLEALIYNVKEHMRYLMSDNVLEKTNLDEIIRWADNRMTDIKVELTFSLNTIVTSGHELSDDDMSILNATDIYSKIR